MKPTTSTAPRPVGFPIEMDAHDFIGHMAQHFRVYHKEKSAEEAQWTDSLVAAISGYDGRCLSDACLHFLRSRKEPRFPLPAEIIAVCQEIMAERDRPTLLKKMGELGRGDEQKANPWSNDRKRLMIDLLRSGGYGARAFHDNWLGSLIDFVRIYARLPDDRETRALRDKARRFDTDRESAHRTQTGVSQMLAKLADSMERRTQLWGEVLEGRRNESDLFGDMRDAKPLDEVA